MAPVLTMNSRLSKPWVSTPLLVRVVLAVMTCGTMCWMLFVFCLMVRLSIIEPASASMHTISGRRKPRILLSRGCCEEGRTGLRASTMCGRVIRSQARFGGSGVDEQELHRLEVDYVRTDPLGRVEEDVGLRGVRVAQDANTLAIDDLIPDRPVAERDGQRRRGDLGHVVELIDRIAEQATGLTELEAGLPERTTERIQKATDVADRGAGHAPGRTLAVLLLQLVDQAVEILVDDAARGSGLELLDHTLGGVAGVRGLVRIIGIGQE